jgi:hypothetical protein
MIDDARQLEKLKEYDRVCPTPEPEKEEEDGAFDFDGKFHFISEEKEIENIMDEVVEIEKYYQSKQADVDYYLYDESNGYGHNEMQQDEYLEENQYIPSQFLNLSHRRIEEWRLSVYSAWKKSKFYY